MEPGVAGHAYDEIRARALAELAALEAVAGEPSASPKFVLAHLPVPHWPFIFDDQCLPSRPVNHAKEGLGLGSGEPALVAAVGAQTTCVDTLLSTTVGRIVESDPDAVVIVFSDHGPDESTSTGGARMPSALASAKALGNLFAARTPGHEALFPEDITLVNVLPTLFNAYLGTQLPTSPNQFWFGPRPADQTFVTEDPRIAMPTPRTRGRTRPRAIVLLVAGLWLVAAPTAAVAMAWPLVAPDRMLVDRPQRRRCPLAPELLQVGRLRSPIQCRRA